jgi:predicted TIM-barrel fold metal-dependent hydrolase
VAAVDRDMSPIMEGAMGTSDRYVVISSDTHCGADLLDYKPYLEQRYHDEFDAWAATFVEPWRDLDAQSTDFKSGISSFLSDTNWDSPKRTAYLESQGICAEVCFPNTVPPFFPSGLVSAPAPASPPHDRREYELRFAGLRAHNRWLADFCRILPGRRAGLAQIFLSDVDDTIAEVRRAREDGLVGVLLPADHFTQLQNVYYTKYDRLWSVLEDLDMTIGRHGAMPSESDSPENGNCAIVGLVEALYFAKRILNALLLTGIFERHPRLRFVITETTGAWVPSYLAFLDSFVDAASIPGTLTSMISERAIKEMKRKPSEYWAEHCALGSFFTDGDIAQRDLIGVDRMMWGADYPHHEGTSPFNGLAYRRNFAGLPHDEVRKMLGANAARVYGFDMDLLQTVADRIGPTAAEIDVPLTDAETPRYPDESECPTFLGAYAFAGGD